MNTHAPRQLCYRIGVAFLLAIFLLVSASMLCSGATWYVSNVSSGAANGTSWANAKAANDNDNFGLALAAGDTINIDGGSTSKSYSGTWTFTADGTAGNRITIQRSLDSGHDGTVNLPSKIKLWGRYTTLDGNTGGAWPTAKCVMAVGGTGGTPALMIGYWDEDATGTIVQRIKTLGQDYTDPNYNVVNIGIYSPGCTVQDCDFYASGGEDQFGFYGTGGNGSILQRCVLRELQQEDTGTQHRDHISLYGGPSVTQTATIRWNIFWNGVNDCIIQTGPRQSNYGKIHVYGNLFVNVSRTTDTSQGDSTVVQEVVLANNTYFDIGPITTWTLTDATVKTIKNNIFHTQAADGGGSVNSAYQTGTTGANTSNGNVIGNVNFANTNSVLGADGIPFTSDDGFKITAGGVGINNGVAFSPFTDLDAFGFTDSTPDDGFAYFSGTVPPPPTPPTAPNTLAVGSPTVSTLALTWVDASSDETAFIISRSTDNVTFNDIVSKAAGSTSHTDTLLASSTTYYYKVRATNAGGDSANSNTASGTTSQVSPPVAGSTGGVIFIRRR